MSHVFVLDTNKQPLPPVHAGRARILLRRGKAAVFRRYPFTIILKQAIPAPPAQGLHLKIDPGSKMTGLAIVNDLSGELAGYEVREYLLQKWGRRCAYCDATEVPLEIEHILCRKRGGTNRVSTLTRACQPCNSR